MARSRVTWPRPIPLPRIIRTRWEAGGAATGLPLVLPPQGLRWLGPLAALRCPVDEAPVELQRLASTPSAWFDHVHQGHEAVRHWTQPARVLGDLAALQGP